MPSLGNGELPHAPSIPHSHKILVTSPNRGPLALTFLFGAGIGLDLVNISFSLIKS